MTSHDTAGNTAPHTAPQTTNPATEVSHHSSEAAPAPRDLLAHPPSLIGSYPRIPYLWNTPDAAVFTRRLRRSLGGVGGSRFWIAFWWLLASLFVGFDQLQQLVEYLRIAHL